MASLAATLPVALQGMGWWEAATVASVVCLGGLLVASVVHVAVEGFRSRGPLRAVRRTSTLAVAYGIPGALGAGGLIAVAALRTWKETRVTSPFPEVDDQIFTGPLAPGALFVGWTISTVLFVATLWVAVAILAGSCARVARRARQDEADAIS